ncbi:MAG: YqaE/Pmp3 family membrane protein [bacterium]|nr:YqaE/Pmp3 family membrane protein [bacterium]
MQTNTLLLVIIAILLPPLAVGLKSGVGGALILNIILTLVFYLPGLLHALYVVLS